jgi:gamma-glutamyl hercynylcysteine S-oxide hydrolase
MCRHLAYLGEPVSLRAALVDPPHGLVVQAWAPRRQRHGALNADGFGIGWYADGDPVPARYRQAGPIWSDESFADLARVTSTTAMLAAVRSATAGTDLGASAAAPYGHGRWLFSHNGALLGWPAAAAGLVPGEQHPANGHPAAVGGARGGARSGGARSGGASAGGAGSGASDGGAAVRRLTAGLTAADLLGLAARCDSALIWALVLRKLRAGAGPAEALTAILADLRAAGAAGRFNLLLTDGAVIAATAAGDTLCYRRDAAGVTVASEPCDDEPGWQDVPDDSVLSATPDAVTVRPLTASAARATVRAGERTSP